ncbi:MAG: hypothetical protein H6935_08520 [Thiobacillus sp.]|nr:hypothetical protein [Thiobacillus sp.]
MNKRHLSFFHCLLATAYLGIVPQARAQEEAAGYTPPPFILIAPATGQNPYLMYVPAPQTMPIPTAPTTPVMPTPPGSPTATATVPQPEAATPVAGPSLSDLGKSLRNYFTEDELDLLFEYMKESVVAAFRGEEVYLPPDLAFKLEILLVRMQKEGGMYMDNLIQQLERDLKRSLKEKLAPPQPTPPAELPYMEPASSKPSTPGPAGASKLPPRKTAKTG